MTPRSFDDPNHWRDRAEEMRVLSTRMNHVETKAVFGRLADDYDKLAERAAERVRKSCARFRE